MDYISFCRNYYQATSIPISLLEDGKPVYSAMAEETGILSPSNWQLYPQEQNPSFEGFSPDIEYGHVQVEGTPYNVFLGPAFSVPETSKLVYSYMRELSIPMTYREQISEQLRAIPRLTHMQFAKHLVFLHQCLNNQVIDAASLFPAAEQLSTAIREQEMAELLEEKEEPHNTYRFEQAFYQLIAQGDVEKLKTFLSAHSTSLNEGKLALDPIRHAKNLFIVSAAKEAYLGAIPGGVEEEKAYQLMDTYVQECERMTSIKQINHLGYLMALDFCERAGAVQLPEGVSEDVYRCMNYIRRHVNEPITIQDAANHVHRSASYMMKHFRKELGISMAPYITRCKLEEAKTLLTFTEKSLAEISSFLCFSSQSYFQNVFKKVVGMTPQQYRNSSRAEKRS